MVLPSFSGMMPQPSSIFSAYASISGLVMLIQTILHQLIPLQFQHYVLEVIKSFIFKPKPNNCSTIVIEDRDDMSLNEIYNAAEIYLCSKIRPDFDRLKISKRHRETSLTVKFAQSEKILDNFQGMNLTWMFMLEQNEKGDNNMMNPRHMYPSSEKKYFELCFDKKDRDKILDLYIPHVIESSKMIKANKKVVRLYTLTSVRYGESSDSWDSINLEHPSTFDTLALDNAIKTSIIDDLDRFVMRKDFYRKVGKAWKRGYLLYGPPGTGKSSLIAAIANYLKFDIYDLELTNVHRDSDLRRLLLRTPNRSILVIEDIDCTIEIPGRTKARKMDPYTDDEYDYDDGQPYNMGGGYQKFSLAGLLNFIDGLWSSCGDERIIIFTTNNKDKLDPALLRPGRMDMHIHMSYLTPEGFKLLASTYLGIDNNNNLQPILSKIENLIETMKVTPAEVAEELMKSDDVDIVLDGLLDFLERKKKINNVEESDM